MTQLQNPNERGHTSLGKICSIPRPPFVRYRVPQMGQGQPASLPISTPPQKTLQTHREPKTWPWQRVTLGGFFISGSLSHDKTCTTQTALNTSKFFSWWFDHPSWVKKKNPPHPPSSTFGMKVGGGPQPTHLLRERKSRVFLVFFPAPHSNLCLNFCLIYQNS